MKYIIQDYKAITGGKGILENLKTCIKAEFLAVFVFRLYSALYWIKPLRPISYFFYQVSKILFSVDIHPMAKIGPGFVIAHLGSIVIGGHSVVGNNVSVNSCVTLGEARLGEGMPKVENNCYISTGAKLLGNIVVKEGSVIGANAVVVKSFDEAGTIVGIPAILKKNKCLL